MTTYGTIPAELPRPSLSMIIRAREQLGSILGSQRKWEDMIKIQALNLPPNVNEAARRIRTNTVFFKTNYVIVVALLLFLTLLLHPVSLVIIAIIAGAWLLQYFLRDNPLSIYGFVIDRSTIITVLTLFTIAVFFLTDLMNNIMTGIFFGLTVVLLHGLFRTVDDLSAGDEKDVNGSQC
ncbi:PRENYLATED RAB ACCEPTOR 1.F2 [Hibiscus trionum]|uniref:PRA1 family protein n=1 Tax=Hibiscus trionum TaxID=183268 RepID=A0A9W7HXV4_HIBTR|nr:PRENYLATED RAB ACCEPTOR 1.F2 [Hibiscus trionum]